MRTSFRSNEKSAADELEQFEDRRQSRGHADGRVEDGAEVESWQDPDRRVRGEELSNHSESPSAEHRADRYDGGFRDPLPRKLFLHGHAGAVCLVGPHRHRGHLRDRVDLDLVTSGT